MTIEKTPTAPKAPKTPKTPKAPAAPKAPKTPPPADEPRWKTVRREFGALPDHVQLRIRAERAAERFEKTAKRLGKWKGDWTAAASEAAAEAAKKINEVAAFLRALPDDYRPQRSASSPSTPIEVGSLVRLRGDALKSFPEYKDQDCRVTKLDDKKARVIAPDGSMLPVQVRSLVAAPKAPTPPATPAS